jgi:hypothetical protein
MKPSPEFGAYYTKIDSGEEFEQYSRTGEYADIIVDLGAENGKFVFWRGSSYLPYWETSQGKWYVDELIPRSGDGSGMRPDKVNTFSVVKIIESTSRRAVIHWRYLSDFSGMNPHIGVDATKFVDEYFTIYPSGKVERTCRKGTQKVDEWREPSNQTAQTFQLASDGFSNVQTEQPRVTGKVTRVRGSRVKSETVETPVAWWKFDEGQGDVTTESISNENCTIIGHKSLWREGISGTALQFDGYNSVITLPASQGPAISSALTLEGWIAIGAYPWSWVPIVQQSDDVPEELEAMKGRRAWLTGEEELEELDEAEGDFTVVLKKEDDVGYFLGIDGYGNPCLKLKVGDTWEELASEVHLERSRWYHVAGTYDKTTGNMNLYVDGKPAGERTVTGADIVQSSKDIKIGQGKPRRPMNPVRAFTFIDSYSFDGLIDEVRIYDVALTSDQIAQSYENLEPTEKLREHPEMDQRILPAGEERGRFGAYYAHLKFYDVWDNLWRFSNHPDVVVEFDDLPSKFVFWRGVGYIPMMVNEKGQWYSNEFNETWNRSGGQGCQEPMSDKESYTNHVRIIENTEARVVVHWRYPLLDVLHVTANYNEETGWGDWSDWYYYIYPDGIAVKKMHLWTHGERDHEWQESMAIFGPNQHPEQIIEKESAVTMVDLEGNYRDYDWIEGPPPGVREPSDRRIQYINYTGKYDPVTIGVFEGTNVYGGEVTPYAVFPTWNHWPVSQMPSDGRYASFPDRTAHSSLTHVFLPTYAEDFGERPYQEKILMEGMLKVKPVDLVPVARSWLTPPELEVTSPGFTTTGYEKPERAYKFSCEDYNQFDQLDFRIAGSEEHPIVNPAFVIENWGKRGASLAIDGNTIKRGKDFKFGHRRTADGYDLIVWVRKEASVPVKFGLLAAD